MKVIAEISHDKYICEIDVREIRNFLNVYYADMKKLQVNDDIDLSKGYDFLADTKKALDSTERFIENNSDVIAAIVNGINVFSRTALDEEVKT